MLQLARGNSSQLQRYIARLFGNHHRRQSLSPERSQMFPLTIARVDRPRDRLPFPLPQKNGTLATRVCVHQVQENAAIQPA